MKDNWDKYVKHGVFAALFISLLFYTMNENRARESDYKQIIKEQTNTNDKFADIIKIDLSEIKSRLGR